MGKMAGVDRMIRTDVPPDILAARLARPGPTLPLERAADRAADNPGVKAIFPPWREKLSTSRDFNVEDFAMTLAAGVGSTVVSAGSRFQLPQSMVGWLQTFSLYVLSQTPLTSATWTVRIDGAPISGLSNVQNPPGTANLVLVTRDTLQIRIPNNATVDVLITNNNVNGPWTVGARLIGWYHPKADELREWGEIP